jgi:hypothetical protein
VSWLTASTTGRRRGSQLRDSAGLAPASPWLLGSLELPGILTNVAYHSELVCTGRRLGRDLVPRRRLRHRLFTAEERRPGLLSNVWKTTVPVRVDGWDGEDQAAFFSALRHLVQRNSLLVSFL